MLLDFYCFVLKVRYSMSSSSLTFHGKVGHELECEVVNQCSVSLLLRDVNVITFILLISGADRETL